MKPFSLHQGDSSDPVEIAPALVEGEVLTGSGWECRTALIDEKGNVLVASRLESVKSEDDRSWVIHLTPSDTSTVTVNDKFTRVSWVVQVSNDTLEPVYHREKHLPVNIKKQGIL